MSQLPDPADVASGPLDGGVHAAPAAPATSAGVARRDTPASAALPSAGGSSGPTRTRLIVGLVLGAAVAALGALLLGEYPFTGIMPYISGVLFALVVAEVIVSVAHRSGKTTAVAAALCTAGGLAWGVWISIGEGKAPIPIGGWVAVGVGAVVALIRGGIRAGAPTGSSNQTVS